MEQFTYFIGWACSIFAFSLITLCLIGMLFTDSEDLPNDLIK